jgi:hypothetical protein
MDEISFNESGTSRPRSERQVEPKERKCLMCRRPFESGWHGERVCRKCKSTGEWRSGTGVE